MTLLLRFVTVTMMKKLRFRSFSVLVEKLALGKQDLLGNSSPLKFRTDKAIYPHISMRKAVMP
jgi:hypothetical protein